MGAVAQSNPVGDNAAGKQVDDDANVVLRALVLPLRHIADPDCVGAFGVELAVDVILGVAVLKPPLPFRAVADATQSQPLHDFLHCRATSVVAAFLKLGSELFCSEALLHLVEHRLYGLLDFCNVDVEPSVTVLPVTRITVERAARHLHGCAKRFDWISGLVLCVKTSHLFQFVPQACVWRYVRIAQYAVHACLERAVVSCCP